MKKLLSLLTALVIGVGFAGAAQAEAIVGEAAPEIEATDIHGEAFKLSDHKGEIVVLEWNNNECPFVKKHYDSGNMQRLQEAATKDGVKWVSIVSSAEGKQGHVTPEEAMAILEERGAKVTTQLLDPSGEIGKAYGAKTTPHMFIVDKDGVIAYAGAIDDNSSPNPDVIAESKNYVTAALASLKAGEPIEVSSTAPYGCGVKY